MRVTWTDLARRNTKFGGKEATQDSVKHSAGVRSPRDPEDAGPDTAEFSLARQREKNLQSRGDLPSSDEDDEEAAFRPSGDGPQEYKSNFGRRKTLARNQLLASESVDRLPAGRVYQDQDDRSSSNPETASRAASRLHNVGEDTDEGDGDEEDINLFDAFKFKSFRRQK